MNRKYASRMFYADNVHTSVYGNNREMMTFDGAGGAYYGTVAAVGGTSLTLSADPVYYPDNMPAGVKEDWTGAVVAIVSGTGAGQYRRVASNKGRAIVVRAV